MAAARTNSETSAIVVSCGICIGRGVIVLIQLRDPETYWLGYAVGASAAWHPDSPDPQELTHRFHQLFYGGGATSMSRVYLSFAKNAGILPGTPGRCVYFFNVQ